MHHLLFTLSIIDTSAFLCQIIFSSLWENLVPFTRDYEEVRSALRSLEDYSKTCIETALGAVKTLLLEEWGVHAPCQVT